MKKSHNYQEESKLDYCRSDNYLMEISLGRRTKINGGRLRIIGVMAANSNVSLKLSNS